MHLHILTTSPIVALYWPNVTLIYGIGSSISSLREKKVENITKEIIQPSHISKYLLLAHITHVRIENCTNNDQNRHNKGTQIPKKDICIPRWANSTLVAVEKATSHTPK